MGYEVMDVVKNGLWLTVYGLLLGLFLCTAGVVWAQSAVTDDEVNAVAKDLFCPVCENVPLDVCPTQACADWRELIRTQLAEGKTRAEIHDYFARQYGDGVLADPPKRGFSLILWVLPLVGVVVAAGLFVQYMRQLRRQGEKGPSPQGSGAPLNAQAIPTPSARQPAAPTEAKTDYIARIEEELLTRK